MMTIDKNSYGSLALVYAITVAVLLLAEWLSGGNMWVMAPLLLLAVVICVWQTLFFRVPVRMPVGSDTVVTAVADGRIVIKERVFEPQYLKCECIQVSIYMNFFDVHANFWPVDGEVSYYKYYPGEHFLAFKPKASEENEHTCSCIRTPQGKDVYFKQLAGTFARRIVCYSTPGLKVKAGAQCGIIKFGSRIDMYLPLDADIKVEIGNEVRACETVIATI